MTPFDTAHRLIGWVKERPGNEDDPMILAFLETCLDYKTLKLHDEIPWCSAEMNWIMKFHRRARSYSAAARSWIGVGIAIDLSEARADSDIVVLSRGVGPQPGPDVLDAPGHVGLFAGTETRGGETFVRINGGNQGNACSILPFPASRILAVRRIEA